MLAHFIIDGKSDNFIKANEVLNRSAPQNYKATDDRLLSKNKFIWEIVSDFFNACGLG